MENMFWGILLVAALLHSKAHGQTSQQPEEGEDDFIQNVSGRCELGFMTILVATTEPFDGLIHVLGHRKDPCQVFGSGQKETTMRVSLLSTPDEPNYCGVRVGKKKTTDEQSVVVVIRKHKALELLDDKVYYLSCGHSDFRNARNELSRVNLNMVDDSSNRIYELTYGHQYSLKAAISKPDSFYSMKVKSCILFAQNSSEIDLTDSNGCPKSEIMERFQYDEQNHVALARVSNMFKFPDSNKFHIQCDIAMCRGSCEQTLCPGDEPLPQAQTRIGESSNNSLRLLASTTGYIVEPGVVLASSPECTEWRFPWLIGLCICLAVLLLVMLIVNIFLCSSLTCTCTKTEVIEKEPSEIEDYDPYKTGWVPPHYGSSRSLTKPYSGSTRSLSQASDPYTTVHSRPASSSRELLHPSAGSHRGPSSHISHTQYPPAARY